jgi:mannose-6-phosphate isomerase-like protein (cupin superfamily)
MSAAYDPSQFDRKTFSTAAYAPRHIDKPWGHELHWTPIGLPYMGKILHLNAGARLSLQAHDQKQESWMVISGTAKVIWENEQGDLVETELAEGKSYSCAIGQRHRLMGVTDCDVLEVSTPEGGITWRLDDDYARPDETDEQRTKEREGM